MTRHVSVIVFLTSRPGRQCWDLYPSSHLKKFLPSLMRISIPPPIAAKSMSPSIQTINRGTARIRSSNSAVPSSILSALIFISQDLKDSPSNQYPCWVAAGCNATYILAGAPNMNQNIFFCHGVTSRQKK